MSSLILNALGHDSDALSKMVQQSLAGGLGGELYMAEERAFSISMSQSIINTPSITLNRGGSLRRIQSPFSAPFLKFDGFLDSTLQKSLKTMSQIPFDAGQRPDLVIAGNASHTPYYTQNDVMEGISYETLQANSITLMQEIDAYARAKDNRVTNVAIHVAVASEELLIARADGKFFTDYRPRCLLSIQVVMEENGKKENGSKNFGLPITISQAFSNEGKWKEMVDGCVHAASCQLTAVDAKAGDDFEIIFGPGFSGGVVLHEAKGHGLEGDFHARGIASFQGMLGKRVASKGVNVYEDGSIAGARGSYNFDDEGNPPEKTLLVDDGILVGLMTDEQSAMALNLPLTGNGRRESYAHKPIVRMSNTYMEAGSATVDDLISSVKKGYYVQELNGGQVDITSSKFVQNGTLVRVIENGKLGAYVKGCSVAGMGNEAYKHITGIANDFELSENGTCGKDGQSAPVTAGQGSMLFAKGAMSVGGTA